jgi:hypothetical protein
MIKKGLKIFKLPAVEENNKKTAPRKTFGPSYFVTALETSLFVIYPEDCAGKLISNVYSTWDMMYDFVINFTFFISCFPSFFLYLLLANLIYYKV